MQNKSIYVTSVAPPLIFWFLDSFLCTNTFVPPRSDASIIPRWIGIALESNLLFNTGRGWCHFSSKNNPIVVGISVGSVSHSTRSLGRNCNGCRRLACSVIIPFCNATATSVNSSPSLLIIPTSNHCPTSLPSFATRIATLILDAVLKLLYLSHCVFGFSFSAAEAPFFVLLPSGEEEDPAPPPNPAMERNVEDWVVCTVGRNGVGWKDDTNVVERRGSAQMIARFIGFILVLVLVLV